MDSRANFFLCKTFVFPISSGNKSDCEVTEKDAESLEDITSFHSNYLNCLRDYGKSHRLSRGTIN